MAERVFERDLTDLGVAWAGDATVAEIREQRRQAAREAALAELADPGPSGPAATPESRRRALAEVSARLGRPSARSRLAVPCPRHEADVDEWCRMRGRREPGQVCQTRGVSIGAPR